MQDGRLAAHAGEVYHGVLQIVIPPGLAEAPVVSNLRVASPQGWRDVALAQSKAGDLGKAGVYEVPFSAPVGMAAPPLRYEGIDWIVDGSIPAPGKYAIAVWKTWTGDAGNAGTYQLIISPNATAAPGVPVNGLPAITPLRGAHPNPFNPRTAIAFDLARPGTVRVDVYTLSGRMVRTLINEVRAACHYDVVWQGDDAAGNPVASGVYLVRLSGGGVVDQRKVILAK